MTDIAELWRQRMYPHVDHDTFAQFLIEGGEGWNETRKEIAVLRELLAERDTLKAEVERLTQENKELYATLDKADKHTIWLVEQHEAELAQLRQQGAEPK